MIDLKHVQELIEKETGSDFEIRNISIPEIIIFFWKHKK